MSANLPIEIEPSPVPPTGTASNNSANAGASLSDNDSEYFADATIPDPPRAVTVSKKDAFVDLCMHSNTCHRRYKKTTKQDIFAAALALDDAELFLGDEAIPTKTRQICMDWRSDTRKKRKWDIYQIAPALYTLGKHVAKLHADFIPSAGGVLVPDAVALVELYNFYTSKIAEAERETKDKADSLASGIAKGKGTKTKPLPIGFDFFNHKIASFHCPGCKCRGTVCNLTDENKLSSETAVFETDYSTRLSAHNADPKNKPKPRRTGHPQMQYACGCETMKTYRGDIQSSTCVVCIKRGYVNMIELNTIMQPDCSTCRCQCDVGIFTESQIQPLAIQAASNTAKAARNDNQTDEDRGMAALGSLLRGAISNGMTQLVSSKSAITTNNAMSAAASSLSRETFTCEADMHGVQQMFGPPSTKLKGTGIDVSVPLRAGKKTENEKRYYQNNLGSQQGPSPGIDAVFGDSDPEFWEYTFRGGVPPAGGVARASRGGVPPAGGVARASRKQAPSRDFDPIAYQGVDEKTGQEIAMRNSLTNEAYPQPPMNHSPVNHRMQSYSPPPVNHHMQIHSPEKPKAKRSKAEQQVDFSARVINKTTERLLDPEKAEAAMNVLEALSSSALNVTKIIVNAKTNQGTPAVGESPAVVDTLLHAELITIGRKNNN